MAGRQSREPRRPPWGRAGSSTPPSTTARSPARPAKPKPKKCRKGFTTKKVRGKAKSARGEEGRIHRRRSVRLTGHRARGYVGHRLGHEMGHGATRSPPDISRARFRLFRLKPCPT